MSEQERRDLEESGTETRRDSGLGMYICTKRLVA